MLPGFSAVIFFWRHGIRAGIRFSVQRLCFNVGARIIITFPPFPTRQANSTDYANTHLPSQEALSLKLRCRHLGSNYGRRVDVL